MRVFDNKCGIGLSRENQAGEFMPKKSSKPRNSLLPFEKDPIKVQSPEALGKEILFALGLELRDSATLWLYKSNFGEVYISTFPKDGIRRILFTRPENKT